MSKYKSALTDKQKKSASHAERKLDRNETELSHNDMPDSDGEAWVPTSAAVTQLPHARARRTLH